MSIKLMIHPSRGGSLSFLEPLIKSWVTVLKDYSTQAKGDRPWWYRERPQVGFLGAAAWRAGGIALEEWRTTKETHGAPHYGRNDLWIRWNRRQFFIEAKHCWCDIYKSEKAFTKQVEKCVVSAKKSTCVMKIRAPRGGDPAIKLAAVFVSPIWENLPRPVHASLRDAVKIWKRCIESYLGPNRAQLAAIVEENPPFEATDSENKFAGCALLLYDLTQRRQ